MKRTIALGRCTTQGNTASSPGTVEVTIKLEPTNGRVWRDGHLVGNVEGEKLSICGNVWRKDRRDIVSGGQMQRSLLGYLDERAPGVTDENLERLLQVWERWHLNDMKPGCEHQRAEGWDKRPIDPSKPTDSYGKHFEGQRSSSWNMLAWVTRDKHPEGLLSYPCPVCDYRYGSAWLYEALPDDVRTDVVRWIETGAL